MINPMISLLVVPLLANSNKININNMQELIEFLENINDFSNSVSRDFNRQYMNKNNNRYRNNYRNGGRNNKAIQNDKYYDQELFTKIKDFFNKLNGD